MRRKIFIILIAILILFVLRGCITMNSNIINDSELNDKIKEVEFNIHDLELIIPNDSLNNLTYDIINNNYCISFLKKTIKNNQYYTAWYDKNNCGMIIVLFEKKRGKYIVLDMWECDNRSVASEINSIVIGETTLYDIKNMFRYSVYDEMQYAGDSNYSIVSMIDGSSYRINYSIDFAVEYIEKLADACISVDDVSVLLERLK